MEIKIEKMKLNDFTNLKDTLTQDFDNFWSETILEEELTNPNSYYFVAKLGEKIVGFAGVKIILDEADLMNIVVKKDHRGHGIGSSLLQHLLHFSQKKNILKLTLEVNEKNGIAISLYEHFDFQTIGMRKQYYKNENAIIMTKYFD